VVFALHWVAIRMISYPDSVAFLYSLGNEIKTFKLGLERIRSLLEGLGHPERACRSVHVAGTNGKGSVCAMIESSLRAAGYRTGLFTSPHLVEPTERIQIGGAPVPREEFARAFSVVHGKAVEMLDSGQLDAHPTYFETVTAMAFVLFRDFAVEIAVIEVGLGGRLDATNVIEPELCVITPVDYDHEAWLGNSLHAIAGEKAGILKPGVPAVFARQHEEALGRLMEVAAERGVFVRHTRDWRLRDLELHARGARFVAAGSQSISIECPLAGEHQVENALTAVAALDALGVPAPAIVSGIRATRWPGRLEQVAVNPDIILDGAHNPAGLRALASYIRRFYSGRQVRIIYGSMRDKSIDETVDTLSSLAAEIVVTAPASPRALRPEALAALFPPGQTSVAANLRQALAMVRDSAPGTVNFITGSLLLVGEARALLVQ
jgi:dihydrofolate synthase/folylpolyglutamate synthase